MADMIVNLYNMKLDNMDKKMEEAGVRIKRALALDKNVIVNFIKDNFDYGWETECERAIFNQPPSCYIAVKDKKVIGFGCYDATALGYVGPLGVLESERSKGIGKALLNSCLISMKEKGYGYTILGFVGPVDYYKKTLNAVLIEDTPPEKTAHSNLTWVE